MSIGAFESFVHRHFNPVAACILVGVVLAIIFRR